jgi:predicted nucleic acid-binding protein
MSAKFLLDTNVLVYAQDKDDTARWSRALELIEWIETHDVGAAVSTQVLGEYFSVVTRKFTGRVGVDTAVVQVRRFLHMFQVLTTDTTVVLEAMRGVSRYQLSYYDAQIWAAARLNGIPLVLSEDFTDGQELEGVRFVNPFAEDFDFSNL